MGLGNYAAANAGGSGKAVFCPFYTGIAGCFCAGQCAAGALIKTVGRSWLLPPGTNDAAGGKSNHGAI